MPRFYCPAPLVTDSSLDLPAGAARHVQVLRLQPGDAITLFNGDFGDADSVVQGPCQTGEFSATITQMGRSSVQVQVGPYAAVERESASSVHLAIGMPANERMDWLVEKATELGVASIQPLMMERSVLRLSGERADKKVAHWHSVAAIGCQGSFRSRPCQRGCKPWQRRLQTPAGCCHCARVLPHCTSTWFMRNLPTPCFSPAPRAA